MVDPGFPRGMWRMVALTPGECQPIIWQNVCMKMKKLAHIHSTPSGSANLLGSKQMSSQWPCLPPANKRLRRLCFYTCLLFCSRGGVSRSTPRGVSRPTPGGVSRPTPGAGAGPHPGVCPGPGPGGWCIPAFTEADPIPQQMATAAGETVEWQNPRSVSNRSIYIT